MRINILCESRGFMYCKILIFHEIEKYPTYFVIMLFIFNFMFRHKKYYDKSYIIHDLWSFKKLNNHNCICYPSTMSIIWQSTSWCESKDLIHKMQWKIIVILLANSTSKIQLYNTFTHGTLQICIIKQNIFMFFP